MVNHVRYTRDTFFEQAGKHRIMRILLCAGAIGLVWMGVDIVNDTVHFNYWHDIGCLVAGVLVERILPWGKPSLAYIKMQKEAELSSKLLTQNTTLIKRLREANHLLNRLADEKKKQASTKE